MKTLPRLFDAVCIAGTLGNISTYRVNTKLFGKEEYVFTVFTIDRKWIEATMEDMELADPELVQASREVYTEMLNTNLVGV